jgi:hypothetical protein
MTKRLGAIGRLAVGDIFHAVSPTGRNLICLVTAVTDSHIQARTVTSQLPLSFDRRTGGALWDEDTQCWIDCTKPLPDDIHQILLGLDRKYQDNRAAAVKNPDSDFRLTSEEKRTLLFTMSFYHRN